MRTLPRRDSLEALNTATAEFKKEATFGKLVQELLGGKASPDSEGEWVSQVLANVCERSERVARLIECEWKHTRFVSVANIIYWLRVSSISDDGIPEKRDIAVLALLLRLSIAKVKSNKTTYRDRFNYPHLLKELQILGEKHTHQTIIDSIARMNNLQIEIGIRIDPISNFQPEERIFTFTFWTDGYNEDDFFNTGQEKFELHWNRMVYDSLVATHKSSVKE